MAQFRGARVPDVYSSEVRRLLDGHAKYPADAHFIARRGGSNFARRSAAAEMQNQ